MPSTPTYTWPYPAPTAPNDVPFDLQTLAEAIEATVVARTAIATYSGTPLTGAYNAAKPVKQYIRRVNVTSDASGFITTPLANTAILYMSGVPESGAGQQVAVPRTETNTGQFVFQMRNASTGAILANTAGIVMTMLVLYQN